MKCHVAEVTQPEKGTTFVVRLPIVDQSVVIRLPNCARGLGVVEPFRVLMPRSDLADAV